MILDFISENVAHIRQIQNEIQFLFRTKLDDFLDDILDIP